MTRVRATFLPFLMVMLLAILVAACGSDDGDGDGGGSGSGSGDPTARDAGSETTKDTDDGPAQGSDRTAGTSVAVTPQLVDCMGDAGFSQDPVPLPEGAVASWRHDGGARVVLAPSSEVALTMAGELGTASAPASVDGSRVSAGPAPLVDAAAACLDTVS